MAACADVNYAGGSAVVRITNVMATRVDAPAAPHCACATYAALREEPELLVDDSRRGQLTAIDPSSTSFSIRRMILPDDVVGTAATN